MRVMTRWLLRPDQNHIMLRGNLYSGFPIDYSDQTGNARTARSCLLSSSTPEMAQSMRSRA